MNVLNRRQLLHAGTAAALGAGLGLRHTPAMLASQATPAATPVTLQRTPLDDLRERLNGPLYLPSDAGYDAARKPANGRYLGVQPMAVAQCADEQDVVTCVQWCTENGVPPVVKGGGHSYAGFSTTTGLLVNVGDLNSVEIDAKSGMMVLGGGAKNGDYFTRLADGPLFLPGGTCLGVGVGGLVLGGGIGYNTHWAGLTCDRLRSSRIVTASGDILDLDDSTSSDLFWACRGGAGGSFGINTQFTFELVPAPETIAYYRFDWRGADDAAAVLAAFHTMLQGAPAALNAVAMAQAAPIGPGGPREAIDVFSRGQYVGPLDELQELVAPLLAVGKPVKQTLQEMTFWDMQRMVVTGEPDPHSFGDISRYAAEPIPDVTIGRLIDLLTECPSRTTTANGAIWSLGWVGGDVVNSVKRTETAYVHRDMLTLLRPTPVWENDAPASVGDGLMAWTSEMTSLLVPHTPNESYQNFPNRLIVDWQQAYYAENLPRLIEVKTKYDDGNLFHHPQSIPPARLA